MEILFWNAKQITAEELSINEQKLRQYYNLNKTIIGIFHTMKRKHKPLWQEHREDKRWKKIGDKM